MTYTLSAVGRLARIVWRHRSRVNLGLAEEIDVHVSIAVEDGVYQALFGAEKHAAVALADEGHFDEAEAIVKHLESTLGQVQWVLNVGHLVRFARFKIKRK